MSTALIVASNRNCFTCTKSYLKVCNYIGWKDFLDHRALRTITTTRTITASMIRCIDSTTTAITETESGGTLSKSRGGRFDSNSSSYWFLKLYSPYCYDNCILWSLIVYNSHQRTSTDIYTKTINTSVGLYQHFIGIKQYFK